jgi:hypothetical protein
MLVAALLRTVVGSSTRSGAAGHVVDVGQRRDRAV